MDVTKELGIMFIRAVEDVTKAHTLIKNRASINEAADRFIKLARRFYDIYKLFLEEFKQSIDCVAARCMLLFIRASFIISKVLFETTWARPGSLRNQMRRMSSAPKRAVHKVIKRTIKKQDYRYNHTDETYEKVGFAKLFTPDYERQPQDELNHVAVGLKEEGGRLLKLFNDAHLIDPTATLESVEMVLPNVGTYGMLRAKKDLQKCSKTLKLYYEAIIDELIENEDPFESAEQPVNHDHCLIPLMERLGMKPRKTLRGYISNPKRPVLLDVTEDEISVITEKLILLDKAPIS